MRILDMSGGAEDNIVEDVKGFGTLMQANAFARAYVRDSMERCRAPGLAPRDVLNAWFAFGEDATILDNPPGAWPSAAELAGFSEQPARRDECDWRGLDPRRENL